MPFNYIFSLTQSVNLWGLHNGMDLTSLGPYTPDQATYCKNWITGHMVEQAQVTLAHFRATVAYYNTFTVPLEHIRILESRIQKIEEMIGKEASRPENYDPTRVSSADGEQLFGRRLLPPQAVAQLHKTLLEYIECWYEELRKIYGPGWERGSSVIHAGGRFGNAKTKPMIVWKVAAILEIQYSVLTHEKTRKGLQGLLQEDEEVNWYRR